VDRRTQVSIGTTHRPMRQEKLDTATADSIEFWTVASPGMRVAGGSGSGCHDPCPQLPSRLSPGAAAATVSSAEHGRSWDSDSVGKNPMVKWHDGGEIDRCWS
jgi:hypothetical protein